MTHKNKQEFNRCSICGKKIGFFRKLIGDTSCTEMIPSNQFCSNKCNQKALILMIEGLEKK